MRIIFLVVFYIIVAKIADGGGSTATKSLGNSMKQFVRQKGRTADGISVDDEMARTTNRRNRQLLLANRIGDWSRIRKLSTSNLRRDKRGLRTSRKSVKDSNDEIGRRQNYFDNDGDNEDVYTRKSEYRSVWEDPESIDTAFNVNPTRDSMITQEAVSINRSLLKRPSGSNLMSPSKRYFLIPVSKDLYVLNNVRDSSRSDERISSRPHKFTERNQQLPDHNANYLSSRLDPRLYSERGSATIAVNSTPLYLLNFLHPHIAFRTRSDVINVTEKSDLTLYDYDSIYSIDKNTDSNSEITSENLYLSTSSFKMSNYDEMSFAKDSTKLDETSQFQSGSWNYKNSLERDEFDKLTTASFQNIFDDDNLDAPVSLESDGMYSTEDDEKIFVDLPQTPRNSLELSVENKNTIDFMDTTSIRYTSNSASVSTYSLVGDIEKKEQSDGKNPQSLLTAIKPLSSELEKLLNAVKLVNQSIRNVQNRLCNENNVVRAARIERGNDERKTTDILKLSDNVDRYNNSLFRKRLNSQPWRKKRIKNKSVTNQTINDTKFKNKLNGSLFLNKLKKHLPKQRKFSNAKIDRSDRNFHKKRKINAKKFRNFNDVKNHRSPHLRLNRNLKSLARNDKRYSALHNAKRAMLGEVQRSGEENEHSTMDPQLQKEISAYMNVLEMLRTSDFAQTTQNVTELLYTSMTTESSPATTFLPYFIEEPTTTASSVTTAGREEFPESTLYEYATGTEFEYYDERNYTEPYEDYEYEDHEAATSWYDYTETTIAILTVEITVEKMNTTLTVAIEAVTEAPITIPTIEEFTTKSTMLLTPTLEGMTDITLKITIPPVVETSIEETVEKITESTTTTTEMTSSLFTSTSPYGFSITPLFITSETEWIPITTVSVSIVTPLITTQTTETTISVTQKTIAVTTISMTVITTKFTEKEMEYTTPFTTQSLATRGPTRATTSTEKTSEYTSVATTPITVSEIIHVITTITGLPTTSKTILTTPTETVMTTLTPTEESTVTQIEKTITAEEITTTETPPTETPTSVEKVTISTTTESKTETGTKSITPTEILTTTTIPTIIGNSTTALSTITKPTIETTTVSKTLIPGKITTETSIETSIPTESLATTKITTPVKKVTTTTISTTTEGTTPTETSTESITPTETLTTTKIPTIIETLTTALSTITKPTITVETITVSKTLIPGKTTTETSSETPTESLATTKLTTPVKKVTTTTISTTTEGTTPTETSTESITPTETLTTTKVPTIIETSTITKPTITVETTTVSKTLIPGKTTTETSIETSTPTESLATTKLTTPVKKVTTTTFSTTTEGTTPTETSTESITPTEILTTTKVPTTIETSTALSTITKSTITVETTTVSKTLIPGKTITETSSGTPTESLATTKLTSVKKVTTTTISTTTEGTTLTETSTESITPTETLTTTKVPTIIETSTTALPRITKPAITVETTTVSKILIPGKTITETSSETPTESLATTKLTTPVKKVTTTTISTTTEGTTPTEMSTESITPTETTLTTETSTQISLIASTTITSITTTVPTTLLITSTLSSLITNITLSETPCTTVSFSTTTEELPISTTISTIGTTISEEISTTTESTTVTFTTITEELTEEITNVTSTPVTEGTLTSEDVTLISTESTIFVTETNITSVPTTTPFTPFFTSLPTLFTTESPAITSESISTLPRTTLTEEFTITTSTTESVSISYTESSSIIFTKKTACPTISTAAKVAKAETEYYVAKGPMYEEEEYEEYDTEIPTDRWYDYETYEVTEKKKTIVTLSTIKHTKPSKITSTFFEETTTSPYRTETSEFTVYSLLFTLPTMSTSSYAYTEEEYTSSTIAETSTIVKNLTTIEMETESFTEEKSTTMEITFGSTEEYTLPSSTVFEIKTKPLPLEYPTISPDYTETESTSEVSETMRIAISERGLTETKIIGETSVFVSSLLTTLSEKEAVEKYTTTTAFLEMETATETVYAIVTLATELITEEETVPYVTPFFTRTRTEFEITETVGREQQKDQLLQQLERLGEHEKELTEKEKRLREKERRWHREKEEREKILREKEAAKRTTASTTASYVATEVVPIFVPTSITTLRSGLTEVTLRTKEMETITEGTSMTYDTEETTLYITEESTLTTQKTQKMSTAGLHDTSLFSVSTSTASTEEMHATSYEIFYLSEPSLTPTFTSPIALISEEFTTTPYTIEELYTTEEVVYTTTEYVPVYSELLFTSSTTVIISPFVGEFTASPVTFSEIFEETGVTLLATSTTEEAYTAAYEDILGTPSFASSPTLIFTVSLVGSTTETIGTTTGIRYDKELEELREKLREKERELEEREKILLEREERLRKDILEFERYVREFEKDETEETLIALLTEPTVSTSFSTPVPPIEKTTKLNEATTQVKKITTGKKTEYIFEETVTRKEEKIATKRICLNVLENTTIPADKTRRDVVAKEICLPYFPEEKRSLGRANRKLLVFQSAKEMEKSKRSYLSDLRYRRRSRTTAATYKINNLQLFHHEWLSNETTKSPQHFKGFTRLYKKLRRPVLRNGITNGQHENVADHSLGTSICERCVFDRHENFIRSTTSVLKENRKRNAFFEHDLNSENKNFFNDDEGKEKNNLTIEENQFLSTENNVIDSLKHKSTTVIEEEEEERDEDENGSFTVNVLRLGYNKNEETHELISAKPSLDELTAIISESYDDYVVNNKNYVEEEHDKPFDTDKKTHQAEESDYAEGMTENYIDYEKEPRGEAVTEFLNQMWPTEKSTTYHLGGTRFWTLDFEMTEPPPAVFSVTPENKPVDMLATTCLYVIVKNDNRAAITKRNLYSNETRKHNSSVEKRDVSFPDAIERISNQSGATMKDPNLKSRKMHKTKYRGEKNTRRSELSSARIVPITDDGDSVIAKSRKLCGVNENKSKHQIVKRKDTAKTTRKSKKKKQLAQLQTQRNVDSSKVYTNSCVLNKKKSNNYHKTMTVETNRHLSQLRTSGKKNVAKVLTHPNNIANRNDKSKPVSQEKEIHDCSYCICDVANVIDNIRSILDKVNSPLDEIRTLNCSRYKDTQDKIIISMDSNVEETKLEFPQLRYNTESLKGQKYIKLDELEDSFKSDFEFANDHDIFSLPGLSLNLPCNQEGDGITWLSSISRPRYTWRRTDGIALFGFVSENGDLELRNVNAKDTGNYTCVMTYMSPDNEEPVEATYEVHLQVITLPRYTVHGENRYHTRSCDERDLDVLVTYLPLKLNSVICETDICNAYVLTPTCSRNQIAVNVLLVPSRIVKLMTVDPKHCNVFCLKAIQDKLSLILGRNLQIFLGKTIIFRLPHYEQRLVPVAEKSSFGRWKRGKTNGNTFREGFGNIGLFSSCPAGYGLRGTRCVPCNTGTYSEDGISHCKKCPPGTYQPNHGARVCRSCTNPLTEGCSNMLWNSFSAVMITLASFSVMIFTFLLLLWICCYFKKKFCIKKIATAMSKEKEYVEERPLTKDVSENEDQQWDSEHRIKNKKGKFYVNKKRRKQNEKRKYEKMNTECEWESHRLKNKSIVCPDSYRSHEEFNNHYPKHSYRKGPQLPECDFDT